MINKEQELSYMFSIKVGGISGFWLIVEIFIMLVNY